jgi:hypothetical protein
MEKLLRNPSLPTLPRVCQYEPLIYKLSAIFRDF